MAEAITPVIVARRVVILIAREWVFENRSANTPAIGDKKKITSNALLFPSLYLSSLLISNSFIACEPLCMLNIDIII